MSITGSGYIKRKEFMLFADVSESSATPEWELQGDKVEEMSLEMNPNIETITDVTGVTSSTLDKYEKQTSVSPYRAKRESKFFPILYGIVRDEKTLSEVERTFLCVNIFDSTVTGEGENEVTTYAAWTQQAIIAVQSYGGGTTGLDIPYSLYWTGEKVHGSFDPKSKTFTAA